MGMGSGKMEDRDHGWKNIKSEIKKMKGSFVKVGFLESSGDEKNGANIAAVANWQEFGVEINVTDKMRGYLHANGLHLKKETTKIKIPARPFMAQSYDENQDGLKSFIENLKSQVMSGKTNVKSALDKLGEYFVGKIKEYIPNGNFVPNHPFTIEQKNSDKPLINGGQLRNSINHETVIK